MAFPGSDLVNLPELEISAPQTMVVRGGARRELPDAIRRLSCGRPLIVTDPVMTGLPLIKELIDELSAATSVAVYPEVRPDPAESEVDAAVERAREHEADCVVAIGGGSSLDTGKAAAVMARAPGRITDYGGYQRLPKPGLPMIAIPTTGGTGSEVTRVTVITRDDTGEKVMVLDDRLVPRVAIVDWELSLSCPADLSVFVGVDSLTHAIESYVSRKANPVTDALALQAAELIARRLPRVRSEAQAPEIRADLMLGATLAGLAFSNASVGLVHGMSRPLGAHFHLPHGLCNAMLLHPVTEFSVGAAIGRYADLGRIVGWASPDLEEDSAAELFVERLGRLVTELDIPRLRDTGIPRDGFDALLDQMAEEALASGSPARNPRRAGAAEIIALYLAVW